MSQHTFQTRNAKGEPVTVTVGYDRPLNYVFCTVTAQDGETVYSNLHDPGAGTSQQDVRYFGPILARLGIHVPAHVFREVGWDQSNRVGNRTVMHRERSRDVVVRFLKGVLGRFKRVFRGEPKWQSD
jgi:hypothetical protein